MPHPPIDTGFRRKRHPRCVPRLSPIEAQSLGMSSRSCCQLTLRLVRAINGVTQSTNHLVLVPSWSEQESKGTQRRRYGPSQDAHIRQCLKRHAGNELREGNRRSPTRHRQRVTSFPSRNGRDRKAVERNDERRTWRTRTIAPVRNAVAGRHPIPPPCRYCSVRSYLTS